MKLLKIILIITLSPSLSFAQGFGEYIKENAIKVTEQVSLDSNHYASFKNYSLIMMGEAHGSKEPAEFVENLAKLILNYEATVSVGIEIPLDQMTSFTESPNDSTLLLTDFFTRKNTDGRKGKAWVDLICYCNSTPSINLFFYDNYGIMEMENRDSAMYISIKDQRKEFPNSKIITLSGNIHNSLIPHRNSPTMGTYCRLDTTTFVSGSICSINHIFTEGTVLNNMGNGLELRTYPYEESVYTTATDLSNYLLFYETAEASSNNCIYYTRYINPSEELVTNQDPKE